MIVATELFEFKKILPNDNMGKLPFNTNSVG